MKRLLLLLLALAPLLALADPAPEVKVRASLVPADSVLVGGTLNLQVDVLVDTWFTDAPRLPKLELDGAVVAAPNGEATHLNERIDGTPFFGLRFNYQITPQRAQAFAVPALAIVVTPGQGDGPLTVHTQALSFSARQPSGAAADQGARLVASQVLFSQSLQASHQPLRVGDSVTRRLQVKALGAQAMLIPPPAFAEVEGLKRYVQTPEVGPLSDGRGGVNGGQRADAVTYVVSETGTYNLPAIELKWWDTASGEAHTAAVPALEITASGAASYQAPFSLTDDLRKLGQKAQVHIAGHWLLWALVLALLAIGWYLANAWGAPLVGKWRAWRQRRRQARLDSAAYAWKQVRPQLQGSPPQLGALYLWLRRRTGCREMSSLLPELPAPTVNYLLAFSRTRFGRGAQQGAAAELTEALPALHRAVATRAADAPASGGLKPLNP